MKWWWGSGTYSSSEQRATAKDLREHCAVSPRHNGSRAIAVVRCSFPRERSRALNAACEYINARDNCLTRLITWSPLGPSPLCYNESLVFGGGVNVLFLYSSLLITNCYFWIFESRFVFGLWCAQGKIWSVVVLILITAFNLQSIHFN